MTVTIDGAPVSVLVVDDQVPFRRAARAVLDRDAGFTVVGEAETGEDAIARARELCPALVLMDIRLPGVDGIAATRRILELAPATIVVLCSTYERTDLPDGAAAAGAAAYVHKEALTAELLRRLWEDAVRQQA